MVDTIQEIPPLMEHLKTEEKQSNPEISVEMTDYQVKLNNKLDSIDSYYGHSVVSTINDKITTENTFESSSLQGGDIFRKETVI